MINHCKLWEAISMGLRQNAFVFAGIVTCIAFSAAGEEHRQLGAHVHGHGRLNIAIEDKTVSIELEARGADIVGFEHEAATRGTKMLRLRRRKRRSPLAFPSSRPRQPPAAHKMLRKSRSKRNTSTSMSIMPKARSLTPTTKPQTIITRSFTPNMPSSARRRTALHP